MKNVVHFSGGKDSTAMLLMMLEHNIPIDYVIFCDTGKEFPAMYKHIEKVEAYTGLEITRLKAAKSFDYYMFDHVKTRGKNKGKCGYGWPTMGIRWCTTMLKQQPAKRFMKDLDGECMEYIGIAADEPKRHINIAPNIRHPLYDWGITEAMALRYCYDKGFDWDGLYEHFRRVSCWCCPLKSLPELKALYEFYPELWQKLRQMDEKAYNQLRSNASVQGIEKRFKGV